MSEKLYSCLQPSDSLDLRLKEIVFKIEIKTVLIIQFKI